MPTLDQEYAQYQGQSVLVPGADPSDRGQCVQWADYVIHDVYGQPYVWLNAIDWWNQFASTPQLANNFVQLTDGTIKKGDFVIFNSLVGSVYGHIDVAMADGSYNQFTGSDTNWAGNLTVHQVNHVGSQYILGVLRNKSNNGGSMLDQPGIIELYQAAMFRSPNPGEINNWLGKDYHDLVHSLNVNNQDLKNKAANFDNVQAELTQAQEEIKQLGNPTELAPGIYKVN